MTSCEHTTTLGPAELDQAALDSIRALQQPGQPDLLTRIIETYLESASDLIESMRGAMQSGDIEVLGRSAHTLKSSSANLGATQVSRICAQLEAEVRNGDLTNADSLIARICRAHEASSEALRRERSGAEEEPDAGGADV